MRKSSVYRTTGIIFLAALLFIHSGISAQEAAVTPDQSDKIIERIYEKYAPAYKKYQGVLSTRQMDVIEYNPNNNKLVNRLSVRLIHKEYFYKKVEIMVLEYIKNDKPMRTSDYQGVEVGLGFPVLDDNGRERYMARIIRRTTVNDRMCYLMKVIPRKKTDQYFDGFMYFTCETLDLVMVEGTTAELPYPMKEFSMKLYINHIKDLPVLRNGSSIMRMYIPVLQPDRRFVTSIKVLDSEPLK
ncbi:MAG: hypothetical protein A2176_14500 [Spirochaetes bacterium RBG_13_51_14]|nr:MAG: hypothetical protein A2176_14500 [Spirochaetes bacterium RBG_13_51_14]